MKCLDLRLAHSRKTVHPVHEFEIKHDDLYGSELINWNPSLGETSAMIFRVYGDPDAYRDCLEERAETRSYSIAAVTEDCFYCLVYEDLSDRDRPYVAAFAEKPVVVIPPVRYRQDRTIEVTVVGASAALDAVLSDLPDRLTIDVRSITSYKARAPGTFGVLTDRQRVAVETAVECGYYASPRAGSVAQVADAMDISKSTAAEHLRKAEATIMRDLVSHDRG